MGNLYYNNSFYNDVFFEREVVSGANYQWYQTIRGTITAATIYRVIASDTWTLGRSHASGEQTHSVSPYLKGWIPGVKARDTTSVLQYKW